jgi:hexosaminidase
MKKIALFLLTILAIKAHAQVAIIPQPNNIQMCDGQYKIGPSVHVLSDDASTRKSVAFLSSYLKQYYSIHIGATTSKSGANISFTNLHKHNAIPGSYTLIVNKNGIKIVGDDEEGVFYAVQSLIQLLPVQKSNQLQVPFIQIQDAPRFAYRGMMLDAGRHFFDASFVKKYIDYLALHKINTFHWHLTEDQGWRIEIKKYPLLTQVGGCRNGTIIGHHPGTGSDNTKSCGYYTQAQIKDIVKYAEERYITIIPEIEMPGHSSAAIAAYPELSCFPKESTEIAKGVQWAGAKEGKQVQQSWGVYTDVFNPSEYTFTFLQNVLDEVIALFPSKYIHIGGDECPKDAWKRSAFCQQLIKDKGLKDEHGLQSYFIGRIEKYLNSKGRNIIGWDEILEGGLAPKATVMSWRGEQGGIEAAKQKHNVIMTPNDYVYFDHGQNKQEDSVIIGGYLPLDKVYSYDPLPKQLPVEAQHFVLGAQANLWSEYITNPAKVEYMLFPRLSALSEVLWTNPANKSWENFQLRMPTQYKRYDLWHANYNKPKN